MVWEYVCVCVDGMNLKYTLCWHIHIWVHSIYANAIYLHMHIRILKPFENNEPTGLKVDVAIFSVSQQKASYIVLQM